MMLWTLPVEIICKMARRRMAMLLVIRLSNILLATRRLVLSPTFLRTSKDILHMVKKGMAFIMLAVEIFYKNEVWGAST
eukprot:11113509-Prorocentrum_lima.AAC.1